MLGDALWNFLTWGKPEDFGPLVADGVVLLGVVSLLVWVVRAWRGRRISS